MTNKRAARRGRLRHYIALMVAGTGAGMLALLAPTAEASGTHHATTGTRTVRVVSTPEPTRAMYAAVRRCAKAPKNVRAACHSLYLRPETSEWPAGRKIVAECFGQADAEAKAYPGPHTWADYVEGCFLGNIKTP